MTYMNWPIQRQGNLFEHGSIEPTVIPFCPKNWMRDLLIVSPGPVVVFPEGAILVAAGRHELEKLAVGHHVFIDFKRWDIRGIGFELVIPAEGA